MEWIRQQYNVPAKRGMRVLYTGCGRNERGTIKSARGSQLNILLDGTKRAALFHPTWELKYYPTPEADGNGT